MEIVHYEEREVHNRLLILAVSACLILVYIDQTGVSLALNSIKDLFNLSDEAERWVINSYTLSLAISILVCGKLGDILGHRKMFILGLGLFLISSLGCGMSFSGGSLIASRVLQGISSALIVSNSIVLIIENTERDKRGSAVGRCIAMASCVGVFGPTIGGFFTQFYSWRLLFLINVPIAIISIVFTVLSTVPREYKPKLINFDLLGFSTFAFSIAGIIISLMEGESWGWLSFSFLSLIFVSLLLLMSFVLIDAKVRHPFVNLSLFSCKKFTAGCLLLLFIQTCDITSAVFWVLYLQNSLEYSAWLSGLLILPVTLPGIYFSNLSGKLLDKFGPMLPTTLGALLASLSVSWIALIAYYKSYWLILPSFIMYGIGESLIIPATITTLISLVPKKDYGLASGVANTMRQIGGALGFSVIGAVIAGSQRLVEAPDYGSLYASAFSKGMWVAAFFSFLAFLFALMAFKKPSSEIAS